MRTVLKGIHGSNPLGFMASVGLLRLLEGKVGSGSTARLGFTDDGDFHAWIESGPALEMSKIAEIVAADATAAKGPQPWWLEYKKTEKKGVKIVVRGELCDSALRDRPHRGLDRKGAASQARDRNAPQEWPASALTGSTSTRSRTCDRWPSRARCVRYLHVRDPPNCAGLR